MIPSPHTQYVELTGKSKFAHNLFTPNKWGKYNMVLYLNEDSLNTFMDLRTKNKLNKDQQGFWINVAREQRREFKPGVISDLGPPKITDLNDKVIDAHVGDGSDVVCVMEVRPYTFEGQKGNAMRLHSVKVKNLVEWVPKKQEPEQPELLF